MNKKKYEKYMKLKIAAVKKSERLGGGHIDSPWFHDFWNDDPTLKQFEEIMVGLTVKPTHFWLMNGKK